MDMNTAALNDYEHRQAQLEEFYEHNRAEIRRRALEMALDDSKSTLNDLRGHELIIDWLTGFTVTPDNIERLGSIMREQFIDDFEERAELELRE